MEWIEGGITAAQGFEAASTAAHIKYEGRRDMAMIYSTVPFAVAGTFTSNVVKAAPVIWDRDIVRNQKQAQAVVVNTGIANACTGEEGLDICRRTAWAAGKALGIEEKSVLIGSTGVIGMQIPVDRITEGVKVLAASKAHTPEAGTDASKAIMTTDTVNKEIACTVTLSGKTVTIGAMSKGSGMIHPNMCTMLAYIATDCAISQEMLQKAASDVVKDTFNMISVDGDTSTNDTMLLMANGLAENEMITEDCEDYRIFEDALYNICRYLARRMAGDGEGATKLIEAIVMHADTKKNARTLSRSIIHSNLTKAAVFGKDANWGRVLCAMGYSGADFDPSSVDVYFAKGLTGFNTPAGASQYDLPLAICRNGKAADYSEEAATEILGSDHVVIIADMHSGEESAVAWGCDLTYDYVSINADYRS